MDERLKNALEKRASELIEQLGAVMEGDERRRLVEDLETIYKLLLDQTKAEWDYADKCDKLVLDEKNTAIQEVQLREARIDRWVKIGTVVFEVTIPLLVYCSCYTQGLCFETEGTFTSNMLKNLIGFFKPKK